MKLKQIYGILLPVVLGGLIFFSCTGNTKKSSENMEKMYEKGTFGYD